MKPTIPAKASYDLETDIFSASPMKREYVSSFQKGEIIFDLDDKGEIVGLELLNASKHFGLAKRFLNKIVGIKIKLSTSEDIIKIKIFVKSLIRNSEKTSALNLERIKPDFVNPSEMTIAVM